MVKFELAHFDQITDIRDIVGDTEGIRSVLSLYEEAEGAAYTIFHKGKVIAICGAVLQWQGVAEAWFLTTNHIDKCKCYFYREVVKLLEITRNDLDLHRMQCTVEIENVKSQKWLESMKFENEGLMKAFGPDKSDHYRYALIWHF